MVAEQTVYCPLCGNKVPQGIAKCPVCATPLKNVKKDAGSEMPPSMISREDYLHKAIPQIQLPPPVMACPQCALPLEGGEGKCPRCGIPLATEEAMLECPECGALAHQGSKACPNCGIGFEEIPDIPGPAPVEEIVTPSVLPARLTPAPPPRPEVVTSVSREVASASAGFVNGRGAINGTGLVNGTGITNGTRAGGAISVSPKRRRAFMTRWQFIAVLVALAVVIPTFVYLSYSGSEQMAVDGEFKDWSHVTKYGMYDVSGSASIDVSEWAVSSKESSLYMYLAVAGTIMSSSDAVESFFLFIDSDDSSTTGYSISGIGADYMFQLDGWNSSVQSTTLGEYHSSDQYNWSAWSELGSLSSAIDGGRLEAKGDMPVVPVAGSKYVLLSQDNLNHMAVSYAVPETGGVLVIRQEAYPDVKSSGILQPGTSVPFLRLTLTAEGSGGSVSDIQLSSSGVYAGSFASVSLSSGETKVIDISVGVSASSGEFVSSSVDVAHITTTFSDVMLIGDGAKAYFSAPPSTVEIDGAFADWAGKVSIDSDPLVIPNTDIDITGTGAVNGTMTSSFYVSVSGRIFNGTFVPAIQSKPSHGGGGGTVMPPRKTGEDFLMVYIDSDTNVATGDVVTCSSKTIGADYLIELKGFDGDIMSRGLYSYSAGEWNLVAGAQISAGKDDQRLEIGVSSTYLSGSSDIDFVIETTDWRGRQDVGTSTPIKATSLAVTGDLAYDPERWIVDASTTSSSATAMSYQRKLFHDGTNFWSFYFDGTDTVYKYSTDGGVTWTLVGQAFRTNGVTEVSLWFDRTNNIVYAVGDRAMASTNIYVQKGTVAPATHTITWQATDSAIAVSTMTLGGKNAFVSQDASGYVWMLSNNLTSASPTRYNLTAWKSTAVGGIGSFSCIGGMIAGGAAGGGGANLLGTILPTGSGSNMWSIYMYQGSVYSRKYTGTWSAQTAIYTNLDNQQNQDLAPASAVVDGNGVIHVVYGNGHEQPFGTSKPYIYYVYNSGTSWSAPYRLDVAGNNGGNLYPTVSLDTSTGSIYAFWIEMDNGGVGRTITGKKNVSGTWTSLSFGTQTSDVKQHLTSVYSGVAEDRICWQWTQNTTGTIHVVFDKLPEFSSIVIPTFFLICLFFAVMNRDKKRRRKRTDGART